MESTPGYEADEPEQARAGALGRVKAVSARPVTAGGERGWWRWLVPALVVVVVLFAAMDVRRVSQDAGASLDAEAAAGELRSAAERASDLQVAAAPAPGERDRLRAGLRGSARQLESALSGFAREAPDDGDLSELTVVTSAAQEALERSAAASPGRDSSRAQRQGALPLSELGNLTQSVSARYTGAVREAEREARRRLTLTLLGGIALLALLMWTFWAKRGAADAERRERRFQALLSNSSDLVMVLEPGRLTVRYVTPVIERMLGHSPDAVLDASVLDLVHPDDRDGLVASIQTVAGREDDSADLWRARHEDGSWIDVESVPLDLSDDRSVRGTVLTIRDVGERNTLQDKLRHQAFHDALTGLPNRSLFEDRVRHAVARARRHGRGLAVLFVDLDDFKTVNDSLGHAAGDDLLRQVAERLDVCTRAADTVARLGGDEFAVLAEEAEGPARAEDVAGRIHLALEKAFDISEHEIFVHSSIGIALAEHGTTSEELLRNADMAMYAAKAMGKGRSETFLPTMHMAAQKRLQLSGDLRRALRDGELAVHYQPLVNLADQRVLGVEALARWQHPELGNVPPGDFIPIAEETGLIVPLGAWVLVEACKQARQWQRNRPYEKAIYVSVNVSARQFRQPGMVVEQVSAALAESGTDPSMLVLEITESVLMQDRKAVSKELSDLQSLGVRVAIDDFGTGYSALSYLREFPIDMVKMDQSFVDDLSRGAGDAALVRSVVELGEALDMQIVAEGIERQDQLDCLSGLQCDVGQGYFFARPLDQSAMSTLLDAQVPRFDATEDATA
jgi:diguanylate cyclase (GGDEF)-like protein/PAS domain S-box-containing protein